MTFSSDEDKGRVFDKLHKADRPIFQIGQARRTNSADDYDSEKIRSAAKRLLAPSVKTARGVIARFAKAGKSDPKSD